jgi:hypothetical protein
VADVLEPPVVHVRGDYRRRCGPNTLAVQAPGGRRPRACGYSLTAAGRGSRPGFRVGYGDAQPIGGPKLRVPHEDFRTTKRLMTVVKRLGFWPLEP